MSEFSRCISAELLKIKRTLALRLAVLAPLIIVVLVFATTVQRGGTPAAGVNPLVGFAQLNLTLWTIVMLPFYAAMAAALLAAIEHSGDNWKYLLTLPISLQKLFLSKWLVGLTLLLLSTLVLAAGICLGAAVLRFCKPGWHQAAVPIGIVALRTLQTFLAAVLLWSIQMWISVRWRNFIVGLVVGVIAAMIMLAGVPRAQNAPIFVNVYPCSLPAMAMARMAEEMPSRIFPIAWGAVGGIAIGLAACRHLSRREY